MSLSDVLNPKLGDYPSPDTYLPSTTGSDVIEVSHKPLKAATKLATQAKAVPTTAVPTTPTMPTIFGQSPTGIYRQLLTAFRSGSTAFDNALTRFNIPHTFTLPFGTTSFSLTRSNGNLQISFNNETVAVIPLILVIGAYIVWCIVWLLLTHNANWHLISRVVGILPNAGFPLVAILAEWLWFRKGYKPLLKNKWGKAGKTLVGMFQPMFQMKPIPPPAKWL